MQNEKLAISISKLFTAIGTVEIRKRDGKIISVKLPKKSCLRKGRYKYKDLLRMTPDFGVGTKFQQKVWRYIRKIPHGSTVTYKEMAHDLGLKRGFQAVGQACRKNPIPIIIPCHRVVGRDGALTGYSSGVRWKRFLLELEKGGR